MTIISRSCVFLCGAVLGGGVASFRSLEQQTCKKDIRPFTEYQNAAWEKKALSCAMQSRFDDPFMELYRLRKIGVLTPKNESLLDKADQEVLAPSYLEWFFVDHSWKKRNRKKRLLLRTLYGQALEIREITKSTHYTLVHAQSSRWLFLTHLLTEFVKFQKPEIDLSHFHVLRIPSTNKPDYDITRYSKEIVCDYETQTQSDLISADLCMMNSGECESARDFLAKNCNISVIPSTELIDKVFKYFCPFLSSEERGSFVEKITHITIKDPCILGHLFVFCIPKNISQQVMYPASPYGSPCPWLPPSINREELFNHIQNQILASHMSVQDVAAEEFVNPQFRIFTPELNPERVLVYLNPSNRKFQKEIQAAAQKIVSELEIRRGKI